MRVVFIKWWISIAIIMLGRNTIRIKAKNLAFILCNQLGPQLASKVHKGSLLSKVEPEASMSKRLATRSADYQPSHQVRLNPCLQRLTPDTCLHIQQLGLCHWGKRGGVRLKTHLDQVRPLHAKPDNLINVKINTELPSPNIIKCSVST